ncbi:MAG: metallophosphoesterase [Cytophagaceae bacterium]|nr:metallophosphoesterase [Gemmatimonadaceae bacterium]
MQRTHFLKLQPLLLLVVACSVACPPPVRFTPPPATATAEEVALAGASVLIGAGDIATCPSQGDDNTARLVDSVLKADSVAGVSDAVFAAGDIVYPSGRTVDFERCWKPSWGSPERRIMKKIMPVPGNHEYDTPGASGYYAYFGERAGPPDKGYYAYNLGAWRIYALNSEIPRNRRFTAADRKAQEDWLRKDMEDNKEKRCMAAYWHHPRFSSSYHGSDPDLLSLFNVFYEGNGDVVMVGHDHTYERFAPQNPVGVLDTLRGIAQIVVGTGGADLRGFRAAARNSMSRVEGYYGVLKLTLGAGEYQHAFLDTRGRIWDPGKGKCH